MSDDDYTVEHDETARVWRVKRGGRYVGTAFGHKREVEAQIEVGRLTRRAARLSRALSSAQRHVLLDDELTLIGFDMASLPVVADAQHRWAVARNGRMMTPTGEPE